MENLKELKEMKVYVIRYESLYSDNEYTSGTMYAFNSLEKARERLEEIKQEKIEYYTDARGEDASSLIHNFITEEGFTVDFFDEYDNYYIDEMEVE